MTEYLSKKAVLNSAKSRIEWFRNRSEEWKRQGVVSKQKEMYEASIALEEFVSEIQSGAFDADESELQRLRAAAIKLHETLNTYWQGDCEKADVVAVQSKLCDVLGADRGDELYGDRTDERCPKCGANLLGNKVGDKWCSMVGCDYGLRDE